VSKIPEGKVVPDEENVSKVIKLLKQDERFKQLAEMLKQDIKEFAEKKAQEALQALKENFTKHGIDRAVELEEFEIDVADILRLKKRGKRYMDDAGDTHILGKIGDNNVWIVLNEDDQVKTVHRINKRKFEKYQKKFKELKK